jgi:hypothetical protein
MHHKEKLANLYQIIGVLRNWRGMLNLTIFGLA